MNDIVVTTETSAGPVSVTSVSEGIVPQPEYLVAPVDGALPGSSDFVVALTPVDDKVAAPPAPASE